MDVKLFEEMKAKVIAAGYGDEIKFYEKMKPCADADTFFREYMWVVLSAGMKNQIARQIESRIIEALDRGEPVSSAFHHKSKARAIEYVRELKTELFEVWQSFGEHGEMARLRWLKTLPWIGEITCFHLAKNLGLDVGKPDRHLQRIAASYGDSVCGLCDRLAKQTGLRVATVDLIIWRAANLGYI